MRIDAKSRLCFYAWHQICTSRQLPSTSGKIRTSLFDQLYKLDINTPSPSVTRDNRATRRPRARTKHATGWTCCTSSRTCRTRCDARCRRSAHASRSSLLFSTRFSPIRLAVSGVECAATTIIGRRPFQVPPCPCLVWLRAPPSGSLCLRPLSVVLLSSEEESLERRPEKELMPELRRRGSIVVDATGAPRHAGLYTRAYIVGGGGCAEVLATTCRGTHAHPTSSACTRGAYPCARP